MWKTIIIRKTTDDYLMTEALNELCRLHPEYEAVRHQISRDWLINYILHSWVKL